MTSRRALLLSALTIASCGPDVIPVEPEHVHPRRPPPIDETEDERAPPSPPSLFIVEGGANVLPTPFPPYCATVGDTRLCGGNATECALAVTNYGPPSVGCEAVTAAACVLYRDRMNGKIASECFGDMARCTTRQVSLSIDANATGVEQCFVVRLDAGASRDQGKLAMGLGGDKLVSPDGLLALSVQMENHRMVVPITPTPPVDQADPQASWWCSELETQPLGSCRRLRESCESYRETMAHDGSLLTECAPASAASCYRWRQILTGDVMISCSPKIVECKTAREYRRTHDVDDAKILTECERSE